MGASAIGDNAGVDKLLGEVGGAGHVAAHALLGCAAAAAGDKDCASGAIGGVSSAFVTSLIPDPTTTDANGNTVSRPWTNVEKAFVTAGSVMASGIIAGASGKDALTAVTAAQNETLNNRLLHAKEISAIKQLAKGDASEEARLTAAACAMVLCYAEFPVDGDAYRQLKQLAIIGASDNLAGERQVLLQQAGMFGYSTSGLLSDANIDQAKQLNNTYQLGTRALGLGQAALGSLGVAGSVVTAPASCATGVGCVANAMAGTYSADAAYAGARQLVSGNSENTFLNQGRKVWGCHRRRRRS